MSEIGDHAAYLADHSEERQNSPIEELLSEWFGDTLDAEEIAKCAEQMRLAAKIERVRFQQELES